MADSIRVKVVGEGMRPSALRSRELASFIDSIEDMIASYISGNNPELSKDQIVIALTEIEAGSVILEFSPNLEELVLPAVRKIGDAVNSGDYTGIPNGAMNALRDLSRFSKSHQCDTEFYYRNGSVSFLTTLTPQTEVPEYAPIRGETIIYGEVTRAGGASEPKVQIRTIEGVLISCRASRETVINIGKRMYETVGLSGEASWNPQTYEIESFRIKEILPYENKPLGESFDYLQDATEGAFDDVEDVIEFSNFLRRSD